MTIPPFLFDGRALTLADLEPALDGPIEPRLALEAVERIQRGRTWVETLAASGNAVYGVNTGFGHLKNKRIPADQLDRLQENLILSHAVGVGPPAPPEIVRLMLMLKTHMLCRGHSGVRVELVERLVGLLRHDLLPVVPTRGSLGASGDLAPLAHLVLVLLGRGQVLRRSADRAVPAQQALAEAGIQPLQLAAKEGLALINGTQFMCAYGVHIATRASRLADLADLVLTLSLEGLAGSAAPFDQRLHAVRAHPGAQRAAANMRYHLRESEILPSHAGCDRVQDPYSLRCAPQVHGAFRDALDHARTVIEREVNSVTDNPILFADDAAPLAISGGNFHGAPLGLVLDYLAIALTDLASISERRIYLLLAGDEVLPKLLMRDTGVNSGFMLPQYTAAALLNECKVLATPASIDSIPTSLGQEDHVSMGATAAFKCFEVLDRVEHVLAIELLCAAQAVDFRAPLQAGAGPRAAHALVRERIAHADVDREFGQDIQAALALVRSSRELRRIAQAPAQQPIQQNPPR